MAKKIIIDTDPGIDDAMAISFASKSPELELIGITTIYGNVSTCQATNNALTLTDLLDIDIPVVSGADGPLHKQLREFPDFVHGKNGFGDISIPSPRKKPLDQTAADFIIESILNDPGNLTIVAIGPLTNLALAIKKEPGILDKVQQIVVMGGAVTVNGNVNPAAEANMLSDPHAADYVLTRNGPIVMVGLDVSQQIIMSEEYLTKVHKTGDPLNEFLFEMSQFYLNFHRSAGIEGLYTHDPSAIAYAINPDLFEVSYGEIRVVTDGIAEGQTIMNHGHYYEGNNPWSELPKNGACIKVDVEGVLTLYRETFKNV